MRDDLSVAARGIRWNYLASGLVLAGQVLYTAATARLISPSQFGDYAAAQALFGLVGYFGLATLGNALIRHERRGPNVTGTALVLTAVAGAFTGLLLVVAAGPWGDLWNVPGSEGLSRAFSLVIAASALSVVPLALLRRGLRFRAAASIEASGAVTGMAIGTGLAILFQDPLALVIGQAAGAALVALAATTTSRQELAVNFSKLEARRLLDFAGHVSAQSILYYGIYTVPSLVISRTFGPTALGIYSRGFTLVTLPSTHLWQGITRALYPLLARARDNTVRSRELVETTLLAAVGLLWPVFAAVGGAAPLLVQVLLGPNFSAVTNLLPPILVFGAFNVAYVTAGNVLEVRAMQRLIWTYQALWAGLLAVALVTSVAIGLSIEGLLWSVVAAEVIVHLAKLRATHAVGLIRLGVVLSGYAQTLALAAGFWVVCDLAEWLTRDWLLPVRCALVFAVFALLVALTLRVLPNSHFSKGARLLLPR